MIRIVSVSLLLSLFFLTTGCVTTSGNTKAEKRQSIQRMQKDVLTELYEIKPSTKSEILNAPGYAVFSNVSVNIIFAGFAGGYGVLVDNNTGKSTYMRMGEVGLGIGLGAKDFRGIFIFHDEKTMGKFLESGWYFGGHADATAKSGDKGEANSSEILPDKITIYQITESGLALQATVKGTKYWKDEELN